MSGHGAFLRLKSCTNTSPQTLIEVAICPKNFMIIVSAEEVSSIMPEFFLLPRSVDTITSTTEPFFPFLGFTLCRWQIYSLQTLPEILVSDPADNLVTEFSVRFYTSAANYCQGLRLLWRDTLRETTSRALIAIALSGLPLRGFRFKKTASHHVGSTHGPVDSHPCQSSCNRLTVFEEPSRVSAMLFYTIIVERQISEH